MKLLKSPGFRLAGWQPTIITPRPQLRKGSTDDKHKPAKNISGLTLESIGYQVSKRSSSGYGTLMKPM